VARTYTRLAETLNHRGIDCLFFSPSLPTEEEPWRGRVIKVPSVPFILYTYYRVGLPNPFRLDKILDRFQPDLIQVAAPTPLSIYGQNYAFRRKLPSVVSYHTHFVDYFPYYGFKWAIPMGWRFMQWFHNRSQVTFAPTPGAANDLAARGFHGVELWPRGIDREKFSVHFRDGTLRQKLSIEEGVKLLLFVGRMVEEKDLSDLAHAARILREKGYRFHLAFAGDGPYRAAMEKQSPLDHFFGFIQGQELSDLYASSDLFVFPSTTETFGNVILEAFASGLPVVAANKGGSADLVKPGLNGLLADPHSPQDFALQIQHLLDRPGLIEKLKVGALETAAQYDWPSINGRLISHYERLIQEQKTAPSQPKKQPLSAKIIDKFANKKIG
jgi:phosphatidylinositol alpha 1,6-mannosyltransferase